MKWRFVALGFILSGAACKKVPAKKTEDPTGNLQICFSYKIDTASLEANVLRYKQPAGYLYGIYRLQYYISGITLFPVSGDSVTLKGWYYLDALKPGQNVIQINGITPGNYSAISFLIGLDSAQNITGGLTPTQENQNMAWPDAMGGGYHFIKLEGLYSDSAGNHGYAVHLGKNINLVRTQKLSKSFLIQAATSQISVTMNINEWFKNPWLYDFNKDGNYTMSLQAAMEKIKQNGRDVFNE